MGQLTASDFQTYPTDASQDDTITPGPNALYEVPVDDIAPTQMNEGLTEVGKKSAGFDLETPAELQADLLTDIEPVVIGPGGRTLSARWPSYLHRFAGLGLRIQQPDGLRRCRRQ